MSRLTTENVRFYDQRVVILVTGDNNPCAMRTVVISNKQCHMDAVQVLRKYDDLAAVVPGRTAFLIYYGAGQWTSRPLPRSALREHPEDVKRFLKVNQTGRTESPNLKRKRVGGNSRERKRVEDQEDSLIENNNVNPRIIPGSRKRVSNSISYFPSILPEPSATGFMTEGGTSEQMMMRMMDQMFRRMDQVLVQNNRILEQNQKLIELVAIKLGKSGKTRKRNRHEEEGESEDPLQEEEENEEEVGVERQRIFKQESDYFEEETEETEGGGEEDETLGSEHSEEISEGN